MYYCSIHKDIQQKHGPTVYGKALYGIGTIIEYLLQKNLNVMNILVIDDDTEFLYLIKNLISKDDLKVQTATNGMLALEIMTNNDIDLVITDAIMPDTPIMSFICTIKKNYPTTPLILISGLPTNPLISNSMILGADEFIAKPINVKTLFSAIDRFKAA